MLMNTTGVENSSNEPSVVKDFPFQEDRKEITEILETIPQVPISDLLNGAAGKDGNHEAEGCEKTEDDESADEKPTEPTDSPFRFRRVSRSFSVKANGGASCPSSANSEQMFISCDDTFQGASVPNPSRFILLRRSRSLGNIFNPQALPITGKNEDFNGTLAGVSVTPPGLALQSEVEELVEKVEALEVEVFSSDQPKEELSDESDKVVNDASENSIDLDLSTIKRPQTSPPNLFNSQSSSNNLVGSDSHSTKLTMLDRMQRSLGLIFRCARRDSDDDEYEKKRSDKLLGKPAETKKIGRFSLMNETNPPRSKAPDSEAPSIPFKRIDASAFVTKVDTDASVPATRHLASLSHFHDISTGTKAPLLGPIHPADFGKKCLVLDLDETLVHSSFHFPGAFDFCFPLRLPDGSFQDIYVAKRPGVDAFLAAVCQKFEVVIFTASLSRYADPVIDFLIEGLRAHLPSDATIEDPLKYRLYRESCLYLQGLYVKDLSRLGRQLSHTVIVDNSPASFLLQPEHGIPIKSWFNDDSDQELDVLLQMLESFPVAESVHSWKQAASKPSFLNLQ